MVNVPVRELGELDGSDAVWDAVEAAEAELGDRGRVLVRASGTEPLVRVMVEAETEEIARAPRRDAIAGVVRSTSAPEPRSPDLRTPALLGSSRMCGIVGYVGPDEALPIVLEGLRRLEYRGYDSAGVAVLDGDAHGGQARGQARGARGGARRRRPRPGPSRWGTRGGRPTARPPIATPIRTWTARAASRSSTTGSSRTSSSSATRLEKDGHTFASETDTEMRRPPDRGAARERRGPLVDGGAAHRRASSRAPTRSSCCPRTSPACSSGSRSPRRWWWGSGTARRSSPPTSPRCWAGRPP